MQLRGFFCIEIVVVISSEKDYFLSPFSFCEYTTSIKVPVVRHRVTHWSPLDSINSSALKVDVSPWTRTLKCHIAMCYTGIFSTPPKNSSSHLSRWLSGPLTTRSLRLFPFVEHIFQFYCLTSYQNVHKNKIWDKKRTNFYRQSNNLILHSFGNDHRIP